MRKIILEERVFSQDFIKLEVPCKAGEQSNGNSQFAMRTSTHFAARFARELFHHPTDPQVASGGPVSIYVYASTTTCIKEVSLPSVLEITSLKAKARCLLTARLLSVSVVFERDGPQQS